MSTRLLKLSFRGRNEDPDTPRECAAAGHDVWGLGDKASVAAGCSDRCDRNYGSVLHRRRRRRMGPLLQTDDVTFRAVVTEPQGAVVNNS